MVESDFAELAAAGVTLLGEVGLSALRFAKELGQLDRMILGTDGPAGRESSRLGFCA